VISVRPLQRDESNTYIINLPPNFGTNSSFNIKGTWLYVIGSNLSFIILLKPLSQYLYHWHKKKNDPILDTQVVTRDDKVQRITLHG
jgi:hypothetical protein